MIKDNHCGRIENAFTRRELLQRAGGGIGMLALNSLLTGEGEANTNIGPNPIASRYTHGFGNAKRVIWLFINGGPSHVDTWDYKPGLEKANGKKLEGFDNS